VGCLWRGFWCWGKQLSAAPQLLVATLCMLMCQCSCLMCLVCTVCNFKSTV
jgi:hypothetical protein